MESNHHYYKRKVIISRYHYFIIYVNNTFVPLDIIIVQNLPPNVGVLPLHHLPKQKGEVSIPMRFTARLVFKTSSRAVWIPLLF